MQPLRRRGKMCPIEADHPSEAHGPRAVPPPPPHPPAPPAPRPPPPPPRPPPHPRAPAPAGGGGPPPSPPSPRSRRRRAGRGGAGRAGGGTHHSRPQAAPPVPARAPNRRRAAALARHYRDAEQL